MYIEHKVDFILKDNINGMLTGPEPVSYHTEKKAIRNYIIIFLYQKYM